MMFSSPWYTRNRLPFARPIIVIPRSCANSKPICVIPERESSTGIVICAAFITISEVNRPVVYRILSAPAMRSIHIRPAIASAALCRPTSSMKIKTLLFRQRQQPWTDPACLYIWLYFASSLSNKYIVDCRSLNI